MVAIILVFVMKTINTFLNISLEKLTYLARKPQHVLNIQSITIHFTLRKMKIKSVSKLYTKLAIKFELKY
jgi:hypothetical protein